MKNFFKPTIFKIALTFFIPFYFGVVGQVVVDANSQISIVNKASVTFLPYVILIFGTMYLWTSSELIFAEMALLTTSQKFLYIFLEVLLPIIINYLIACVIVYLIKFIWPHNKKKIKNSPPAKPTVDHEAAYRL